MKLYYLVRKDLPWAHRAVQMVHAREAFMHFFSSVRGVRTAVAHVVKDEAELRAVLTRLSEGALAHQSRYESLEAYSDGDVRTAAFKEPDLGHELTAICTTAGPFELPLL